jgi:hypothetical protein
MALGEAYEKVTPHQLIGIFVVMFALKDIREDIKDVQKSRLGTGYFGLSGNKGGTAIRFTYYDTSFCFVNVYLRKKTFEWDDGRKELEHVFKDLTFNAGLKITNHDCIFFFGDLNYRVNVRDECAYLAILRISDIQLRSCTSIQPEVIDIGDGQLELTISAILIISLPDFCLVTKFEHWRLFLPRE